MKIKASGSQALQEKKNKFYEQHTKSQPQHNHNAIPTHDAEKDRSYSSFQSSPLFRGVRGVNSTPSPARRVTPPSARPVAGPGWAGVVRSIIRTMLATGTAVVLAKIFGAIWGIYLLQSYFIVMGVQSDLEVMSVRVVGVQVHSSSTYDRIVNTKFKLCLSARLSPENMLSTEENTTASLDIRISNFDKKLPVVV